MGVVGCGNCRKDQKENEEMLERENIIHDDFEYTNRINDKEYLNSKNIFENIFNSKINELGVIKQNSEFNDIIPQDVSNYMRENPFDKNKYESNDKYTYLMDPLEFPNGNIYKGNWNDRLEMDGYGNYILKKDDVFVEGIWDKGILKYGRIFLPNGDIYEGDIENNLYQGEGKYINHEDGTIYEGFFDKGERNKFGKIIYKDGSYYEGNLINDNIPDGQGVFKWIDPTLDNNNNYNNNNNGYYNYSTNYNNNNYKYSYSGEFINGKIDGYGILKNEYSKSEYKGDFKNNVFHGKGVFQWGPNGLIRYEGEYKFGEKNGNGNYIKPNFKYSGFWNEGKPHGLGLVDNGNGIYKCSWRNGVTVETPVLQNRSNDFENIDINFKPEKEDIDFSELKHLKVENFKNFNFTLGGSFDDFLN